METVASVIFMNSPFPTIDFVLSEPRLRMIKKKKKKKRERQQRQLLQKQKPHR